MEEEKKLQFEEDWRNYQADDQKVQDWIDTRKHRKTMDSSEQLRLSISIRNLVTRDKCWDDS
jgi:hypothetical protein